MSDLKTLRLIVGLTQEQVAEFVGVTQGTVSAWENGYHLPGIYKIALLAGLYNCTVEQLLTILSLN
jgi:transcriptional regulator with XRE-family HTH domain